MSNLLKINSLYILLIFLSHLFGQVNKTEASFQKNNRELVSFWSKFNQRGLDLSKKNFSVVNETKLKNSTIFLTLYNYDRSIKIGESFLEIYFKRNSKIKIGKFYKDFSFYLNDNLSSGSMLISKNAEPMPKISYLGKYIIDKKSISFNYGISNAFFKKNNFYNKSPMLHEKYIYLGKNSGNRQFGLGLVHEAIWGGSTLSGTSFGKQPSTLRDFFKIMIAADGIDEGGPHVNSLGNHLGIWDFYYLVNNDNKILKLYYQHFFEDTSGLRFANKYDGLWGIELKNYIKNSTILFEFLSTINQNIDPPYVDDSYYNHGVYRSGWSYKEFTLGNPFISFDKINPSEVLHLALDSNIIEKINFKIIISKVISSKSDFLSTLLIKREIKNNQYLSFELYPNENYNAIIISYNFNI